MSLGKVSMKAGGGAKRNASIEHGSQVSANAADQHWLDFYLA